MHKDKEISYIYIFIREDISAQQQIIQSAHAVDQMNNVFKESSKPGSHIVLIGVKDALELYNVSRYLFDKEIPFTTFFEPDMDSYTAISTAPLHKKHKKVFRKFKLK